MLIAGVIERAERVMSVRADVSATAASLTSAMRSVTELRSFLAAADADLAIRLRAVSSFPEPEIAEVSRESLSAASKLIERGETLAVVAGLADALDNARVTAGHVDAVTRGAKALEPEQREALFSRVEGMVDEAAGVSVAEFARWVRREADQVRSDDGMAKLERQRRATSMSSWTDDEGMWNVRGRFDPVTALSVSAVLERAVETLFAEAVPESCPSDPLEKQKHLRALAFARLVSGGIEGRVAGGVVTGRSGRAEYVAVIDVDAPPAAGAAAVEWPIPIEVPGRVLHHWLPTRTFTPWSCATGWCYMRRAISTSGDRLGWRTGRNDVRFAGSMPHVRSPVAPPDTTVASCIMSCGGEMAAGPTWTTCYRCARSTITPSTIVVGTCISARIAS
jgi:hypothetical protein